MNRAEEGRHRFLVRGTVTLLLAMSVIPATGRIREAGAPILERCHQILEQCVLALRASTAPLRWLPVLLLVIGVLYAVIDRVRLSARVHQLLLRHRVRPSVPNEMLGKLAHELHCTERLLVILDPAPNPAFTAGLFNPRIYIGERLQRTLTESELRAVFRHEYFHLRRRDPLRFALIRFAGKALFWMPLVRLLGDDMMQDAELIADDFAAAPIEGSDSLDVASALVKLGRANAEILAGVAAIGGFGFLDRRVRRLAGEFTKPIFPRRWRSTLLSAGVLSVLWISSALADDRIDPQMSMRFGDSCPHRMDAVNRNCPECEHGQSAAMPDCKENQIRKADAAPKRN